MKRRRNINKLDRRVVAFPQEGVQAALSELTAAIANSNCTGVVLAIHHPDGTTSYALHGEMPASQLALVSGLLMRWATGD